jgi:hypothetical protein
MNTYLITPKYVLGSDSFYVKAPSHAVAIEKAKEHIKREDWHSPNGWDVLMQVTTFEDDNA